MTDKDIEDFKAHVASVLAEQASAAELEADFASRIRAFVKNGTTISNSNLSSALGQSLPDMPITASPTLLDHGDDQTIALGPTKPINRDE